MFYFLHIMVIFVPVTSLHWRPLQNATISKMKSDNCKALQKNFWTVKKKKMVPVP
jgi:hypothetical protein